MILRFIFLLLLLASYTNCYAQPRIDLAYHFSNKPWYESRAFLPIVNKRNNLLFAEVRGITDFNNSTEFNLGIGARSYINGIVLGGYYFYDRRYQESLFQQNTIGAEILSKYFIARGNFYIPFDQTYSQLSVSYPNMQPQIHETIKKAMRGGDLELGLKLPLIDLWFYGGVYKFEGENKILQGKKVRTELDITDFLPYGLLATVGAEYDHGDENKEYTFNFRLGIPLCKSKNKKLDIMFKPIVRDVDIRIEENIITENAIVEMGSYQFDEVVEIRTEGGLHQAIQTEQKGAQRAIIIKDNIFSIRPVKLAHNQRIIGDNIQLTFVGETLCRDREIGNNQLKLSYLNLDNIGNIYGVNLSKAEIYYDGRRYDKVDFVSNETEFTNALSQEKPQIIVLDGDIIVNEGLSLVSNLVIMGKGSITLRDESNDEDIKEFTKERKITRMQGGSNLVITGVKTDF